MNESYEKQVYSSSDMLSRFCYKFFKQSPISSFDYARYFDDGKILIYSTVPEAEANCFQCLPTRFEFEAFSLIGQRLTYMSHLLDVPPGVEFGDCDKYLKNIDFFSKSKTYHRLYFVDRFDGYFRVSGFGVNRDNKSVFNYYLNNFQKLERFIRYFEFKMSDVISDAVENYLVHLHGYLEKPNIDIEALFPSSVINSDFIPEYFKENYITNSLNLTQREKDCVTLIAKGYTMKTTAKQLGISPRTVEQHIRNIKDRHDLHNKQQIIDLWYSK